MADAKQVQIRRDTAANLAGVTPALGELAYDTTNKTLRTGDGVTAGGSMMPNVDNIVTQKFSTGTVGGTANAITLTLPQAPANYSALMRVSFIPLNDILDGGTTINLNSLGARSIKKYVENAKVDVEQGDIFAGKPIQLVDDGTDFILEGFLSNTTGDIGTPQIVNTTGSAAVIFNVDFAANVAYEGVVTRGGTNSGQQFTVGYSTGSGFTNITSFSVTGIQPFDFKVTFTNGIISVTGDPRGALAVVGTPTQIRISTNSVWAPNNSIVLSPSMRSI